MKNPEQKLLCILALCLFTVCGGLAGMKFLKTGTDFLSKDGYIARVEAFKADVDNICTGGHPYAARWKSVYGWSAKLLDRTVIPDAESDVYRLRNGQLAYIQPDMGDPSIAVNALSEFKNWLSERNIGLYHIITAQAADERQGQLPPGVETDHCEEAVTALISGLSQGGVEYLDTYALLTATDRDYYDYFYRTDHHWNEQAALVVSREIGKHLQSRGFDVDLSKLAPESYAEKVYPKMWLGSCGKKACMPYAEPEDFRVLTPTFGTWYHLTVPSRGIDLTGTYENTLLDKSCLGYGYYNSYCYSAFLWGDKDLIRVQNLNCASGPRLLVLKDSKANVVNIHLSTVVSELRIIDLRSFEGSLKAYIEDYRPDLVITSYSPFVRSAEPEYLFD